MDRDEFIITVYCLVCEHYQMIKNTSPVRRGGFAPSPSDEEVITMELCSEYFKLTTDKDLFAYFRTHHAHFFPHLTDRTLFARQAANLWHVKATLPQWLTQVSGQAADPVQIIDTLPLPVCSYTRSGRDPCFPTVAEYGHCAAKQLDYYSFKLGLRITRCGLITHYSLLPAQPHDIRLVGLVPADKGFIDAYRQQLRAERHGAVVVTTPRKGMTPPHPPILLRLCARLRKGVETVGSPLTERFAVARIRVRDFWHFQHRLIRKVLAHAVGVFLNLQLGRPPTDLDGLVSV